MKQKLFITEAVSQVVNQDALNSFPNECCGFLYGKEIAEERHLELAVPIKNSKEGDQRRRFEIAPLDYIKAEQYALENEIQLLGIYHSHPNHPAIASEHDLAKAMPFFSYLIVSVMDGKIAETKSWKLYEEERKFYEENLIILKPNTI